VIHAEAVENSSPIRDVPLGFSCNPCDLVQAALQPAALQPPQSTGENRQSRDGEREDAVLLHVGARPFCFFEIAARELNDYENDEFVSYDSPSPLSRILNHRGRKAKLVAD